MAFIKYSYNFIWAGVRINKAIINVVYIFKIKADD